MPIRTNDGITNFGKGTGFRKSPDPTEDLNRPGVSGVNVPDIPRVDQGDIEIDEIKEGIESIQSDLGSNKFNELSDQLSELEDSLSEITTTKTTSMLRERYSGFLPRQILALHSPERVVEPDVQKLMERDDREGPSGKDHYRKVSTFDEPSPLQIDVDEDGVVVIVGLRPEDEDFLLQHLGDKYPNATFNPAMDMQGAFVVQFPNKILAEAFAAEVPSVLGSGKYRYPRFPISSRVSSIDEDEVISVFDVNKGPHWYYSIEPTNKGDVILLEENQEDMVSRDAAADYFSIAAQKSGGSAQVASDRIRVLVPDEREFFKNFHRVLEENDVPKTYLILEKK